MEKNEEVRNIFEKTIDEEKILEELELYIGKNGVSTKKVEGDMKTPLGIYNIGFAFGLENINCTYPYYKINEDMYWIDDINSKYYNCCVILSDIEKKYDYDYIINVKEKDWISCEHLIDYKIQYELGLLIEYNLNPIIKGKGSAIFMHIKNKNYTEGCISTNKENMYFIINWLKTSQKGDAKIWIK